MPAQRVATCISDLWPATNDFETSLDRPLGRQLPAAKIDLSAWRRAGITARAELLATARSRDPVLDRLHANLDHLNEI
jgi:hypothetical protein